jgi:hypothetical protein
MPDCSLREAGAQFEVRRLDFVQVDSLDCKIHSVSAAI